MKYKLIVLVCVAVVTLPGPAHCWMRTDGVSYTAQTAPVSWIDARLGFRHSISGDDEITVYGLLPFFIKFYGIEYSYIVISTNGLVGFNVVGTSSRNNSPLPYSGAPNNIICPFWMDLLVDKGAIYTYYDSADEIFVVQWDQVTDATYKLDNLTFQVQFVKATSEIRFAYLSMTGTTASGFLASVGIENSDGATGIRYTDRYTAGLVWDGLGLIFTPYPALPIGTSLKYILLLLLLLSFLILHSASFSSKIV
jgi:hypothetical protein